MYTVTLNSKNQIVIPKEARDAMRIKANDKLLVVVKDYTTIILPKPKKYSETLAGIGKKLYKKGHTKMYKFAAEKRIPDKFIALFWDAEPSAIDIKKNARYIIERVLEMGGMDAIQWLQRIYPTKIIIEVCESSRKVSLKSRNFWRIWFGYKYA